MRNISKYLGNAMRTGETATLISLEAAEAYEKQFPLCHFIFFSFLFQDFFEQLPSVLESVTGAD